MMRTTTFIMAVACVGAVSTPAMAQSKKGEHWVATWAPALVVHAAPAAPRQGGPGGGAGPLAAAPPAAAAPQAPVVGPGGAGAPAPPRGGGPGAAAPGGAGGPGGPGGRGGRGAAPPVTLNNQTVRQIVHPSPDGRRVRVVLSNASGTAPLQIGAAHAALRECADSKPGCTRKSEAAIAGAAKPITVDGKSAFTVVAGGSLVTDPIDLD